MYSSEYLIQNLELKQKSQNLECEIFQRSYELKKKQSSVENTEKILNEKLMEEKLLLRRALMQNKQLSEQYHLLQKKK